MKVAAIALITLVATVAFPSSVCSMPTDSSQVTPVDGNAVVEIKLSYITLPGRRLDLRLGEAHANELAEDIFQSAQDETLATALDKIRQAIVNVAKQPRLEYQMDPVDQTPYKAAVQPLELDQDAVLELLTMGFSSVETDGDRHNIDTSILNAFVSELAEVAIDCIENRHDFVTGFLGYLYNYYWNRTPFSENAWGSYDKPDPHFQTFSKMIDAPIEETIDRRHPSMIGQSSSAVVTPKLAQLFGQPRADRATPVTALPQAYYGSDVQSIAYRKYADAMIAEDRMRPRDYSKRAS